MLSAAASKARLGNFAARKDTCCFFVSPVSTVAASRERTVSMGARTGGFASHCVQIDAPAEVVWDKLVDKIRRPDKYVPGVTNVQVVKEFGELSIERKMDAGGKTVHEYITADPLTKTVVFKKAEDDPLYRGFVTNTLFEEGGQVFLDYTMNWIGKGSDSPDMQEQAEKIITGAVVHTKELAEAAAATV